MSSAPTLLDTNPAHPSPEHASDFKLARDAIQGNAVARKEFARRIMVVGRILSVRNKHMGNPLSQEELADLAQETILKIWNKLEGFEGRSSIETWAYRYCFLELMNAMRRRSRQSEKQVEFDSPAIQAASSSIPRPAGGIDAYLKHLSTRESQVVRLRHVESMSLVEAAEQLSISVSSTKTHYYRALDKLRAHLAS
jgi:RNA polymerase sigma-70 factor (ECF subfamily)